MLEMLVTIMFSTVLIVLIFGFGFLMKDLIKKEKEINNKK